MIRLMPDLAVEMCCEAVQVAIAILSGLARVKFRFRILLASMA